MGKKNIGIQIWEKISLIELWITGPPTYIKGQDKKNIEDIRLNQKSIYMIKKILVRQNCQLNIDTDYCI